MGTELTPTSNNTIDVSGLPDPVVRDIRRLVDTLRTKPAGEPAASPRLPLRGRFAGPGLSLPKEEIDAARSELWSGFPRDLPDPGPKPS